MSKLFMPISIVAGLLAGQIAKKLFAFTWGRFADAEAPDPKHREIALGQLVAALVLEGAIAKLVRGMADHGLRHAWANRVGEWPGEERPEPE
jgi:Protein of unknown function (DUF4235)